MERMTKGAVSFCHWSMDQINAVTGLEQTCSSSSLAQTAVTGLGKPYSFILQRFLEQLYSRKEVDALCSCHSAEIRICPGNQDVGKWPTRSHVFRRSEALVSHSWETEKEGK
uniref:(California timema) hypothetical protein n=1 Tax=Timema californicum TaxID=61474 RepID=A0A7R9JE92_TIMCA|nr:unnamed protein product [Timema californicum]